MIMILTVIVLRVRVTMIIARRTLRSPPCGASWSRAVSASI